MKPTEVIAAKHKHLARLANKQGAAGELRALNNKSNWVARPRGKGLKILLEALRAIGIEIKPSSFDAIELPEHQSIDFNDAKAVELLLPNMIFIEIKTSNQSRVKQDFSGFFFALTESEIVAAEVLGARHQVVLQNNITGEQLITSVPDILKRAKSSSWQLSVQL